MQTETRTIEEAQESITEMVQAYKNELKRERQELMKLLRNTDSQHVIDIVNGKLANINDELDKLDATAAVEQGDLIEFVS